MPQQWQATFDAISDAICLIDPEGVILQCNKAMGNMLSRPVSEVIGNRCWELVHGTTRHIEGCPIVRMFETRKRESTVSQINGRWVSVVADPVMDEAGNLSGGVHTIYDITEQKDAEEERNKLLKGVSACKEGIAFTDKDDRFYYVNAAHAGIYGYTPDELIGKSWRDIAPPELVSHGEEFMRGFLYNKKVGEFAAEFPGRRKDGSLVPTEVTATALWDGEGNYNGHVCIVRDITERKDFERQRADFYAMLTHDIKSPLTAILGNMELLDEKVGKRDADLDIMIASIRASAVKLHNLAEDFLSISSVDAGKLVLKPFPADISQTLKEASAGLEKSFQKKGFNFNIEMAEDLPKTAIMDPRLVQRAVSNLLQNAISYSAPGGRITLRAEKIAGEGGDFIMISVTDTGLGIPAEEQARVFDKYYRSPNAVGVKGTGLGLAIVRAVAEAHGGEATLTSEAGKGSTFRILLPITG